MWTSIVLIVLRVVVVFGAKKLKDLPDGLPKKVSETILDAIAESKANNSSTDLIETVKAAL